MTFILYDFAVDIRSILEPINSLSYNIPAKTSFYFYATGFVGQVHF